MGKVNKHEMDRWDTDLGDTFACRYEIYLTDIDIEPDHKKWIKEVAIKTKIVNSQHKALTTCSVQQQGGKS